MLIWCLRKDSINVTSISRGCVGWERADNSVLITTEDLFIWRLSGSQARLVPCSWAQIYSMARGNGWTRRQWVNSVWSGVQFTQASLSLVESGQHNWGIHHESRLEWVLRMKWQRTLELFVFGSIAVFCANFPAKYVHFLSDCTITQVLNRQQVDLLMLNMMGWPTFSNFATKHATTWLPLAQ